ncbi:hypothetical protein RKD33_004693 [Streptomyces sp. SAI-129]
MARRRYGGRRRAERGRRWQPVGEAVGQEDGAPGLGFHRLPDYRPLTWPGTEQEKQAHIDVGADDLDTGEARLLALGATKPD